MTTYCGEKFLKEQLVSLLDQKRAADEVVICDDCSMDSTAQMVRSFIQEHHLKHWKFVVNEQNLGYVENFRKAMGLTTGDLVFPCDQDDVWFSDKIQRMEEIFLNHPQIQALACGYQAIDAKGAPLNDHAAELTRRGLQQADASGLSQIDQHDVLYSNIAQGCACAYRREIVDAYCAAQDLSKLPHDWAMNMLAHEKQGLYFVDAALLGYRIHENNTIGIQSGEQSVSHRIPLLQEYADCMADARNLPMSQESLACLTSLMELTQLRIQWLQQRKVGIWFKGFVRYFPILRRYFFLQYMKDLAVVLLGKGRRNTENQ